MRRIGTKAVLLAVATLWTGYALACEPNFSLNPTDYARADRRLQLAPDCSFEDQSLPWTKSGNPVRDRGEMIIGQKLQTRGGCTFEEQLLVVDCATGETIVFEGIENPNGGGIGGGSLTSIEFIQPPYGPINVTANSTIPDLIERANSADIEYFTDFVERQMSEKRKNRYDAFCGCRLFYPGSVGAAMPLP